MDALTYLDSLIAGQKMGTKVQLCELEHLRRLLAPYSPAPAQPALPQYVERQHHLEAHPEYYQ